MNVKNMKNATTMVVVVAAVLAFAPLTRNAEAAAPQLKSQAPGFYRLMVGAIEVTVLSDGTVDLPFDKLLTNTTPENVEQAFSRAFLKVPVETSVNAFLINTGTKLVLVDTGAGSTFGPTLGNIQASLAAAGYQAEQIDEIYITHMHGDHLGGLAGSNGMAFPNATVRFDKREGDFWLSETVMNSLPEKNHGTFKGAMALVEPYSAAGKVKPFDGKTELVPGVTAIPAYGHTAGHTIYVVDSQGQRLVLWGDLMHVAAIQFAQPAVTIQFDSDSPAAARTRAAQFAEAARLGSWVAATHLQFPAIGHLRTEGDGYAFVPANYMRMR